MGLVLGGVYFSLLLLVSAIALAIGFIPIRMARENRVPGTHRILPYAAGATVSLLLTVAYAWWYSTHATSEWGPIFGSLAISLAGPPVIGLILHLAWLIICRKSSSAFNFIVAGAWHSTIAMPVVGALVIVFYDDVVHKRTFDQLCAKSQVVIFEKIDPAKSVAFIPDTFFTTNRNGRANQEARTLLLGPNTPLQYIDARVLEWDGRVRFVRVTRAQQSDNTFKSGGRDRAFNVIDIEAPNVEYEVIPSSAEVPKSLAKRTYGQKVEIFRVSDKKLIARAEYYWDTGKWWECPAGIDSNSFIRDFIATSLNIPKR
jgi:hypothetical protein